MTEQELYEIEDANLDVLRRLNYAYKDFWTLEHKVVYAQGVAILRLLKHISDISSALAGSTNLPHI